MNDDLISRSALCEKLQAHKDFFVNAWGGFGNLPPKDKARVDEITHCIDETMNAPSVDAVIPVRCGECKNWDTKKLYCHHPAGLSFCGKKAAVEGFCCFGERRADNGNEADN